MNKPDEESFFCSLLSALHVRHTVPYSCRRFQSMPLMSWFGLGKLLREYGVESCGVALSQKDRAADIPTPFIAPVRAGVWVIVTGFDRENGLVSYISDGLPERAPIARFTAAWNGCAMVLSPTPDAREPHYFAHRFAEIMAVVRNVALVAGLLAIIGYFTFTAGLYRSVPGVGLVLFNIVGIFASVILSLKSVGIRFRATERVCSAIKTNGCDHVIDTGGTFMGIFHWSEVGIGYFGVSLLALLLRPECIGWLAVYNACCLPYSFWSVAYQKFKAKSWCTFCLIVQATLWILAGLYLWDGAWHGIRLQPAAFLLPVAYVTAVMALNLIFSFFSKKRTPTPDDNGSDPAN